MIASAAQDGEQGFNPDTSFRPIDTDDLALPTEDPYINEIMHSSAVVKTALSRSAAVATISKP